jgi:hypothetical protein
LTRWWAASGRNGLLMSGGTGGQSGPTVAARRPALDPAIESLGFFRDHRGFRDLARKTELHEALPTESES